jgi:hypothetical protein
MNPEEISANPMFDLLGVRYVLTTVGSTRLDQLPGPASGQFRLAGSAASVNVFENQSRIARAFIVHDVHSVGGQGAALSYLQSLGHTLADGTTRMDQFDPRRQAVVEMPAGSGPAPTRGASGQNQAPRAAHIVSYTSQRVVVDVPAGAPGLLVLTDAYYPGWGATVNGHPAPILATDVAFRGVPVGSAASRIVFAYRSPGGDFGWGLPLLGLLGLVAAGLVARVRRPKPMTQRANGD